MQGGREVAWVGLVVAGFAALHGLDPDAVGSPASPELSVLMAAVAVALGVWLLLDRRHHSEHRHPR